MRYLFAKIKGRWLIGDTALIKGHTWLKVGGASYMLYGALYRRPTRPYYRRYETVEGGWVMGLGLGWIHLGITKIPKTDGRIYVD